MSNQVWLPARWRGAGRSEAVMDGLGQHVDRKWMLGLLAIGYLWFRLIDGLRLEWSSNPQYSYGWIVPVLCAGLLVRRWEKLKAESGKQSSVVSGPWPSGPVVLLLALLAFLYLPTRLVEAAVPEWRPVQWMLAIETVGLTLGVIYFSRGLGWLIQLAFPICFILVAVPWPTPIEAPIIQGLTKLNTAVVVETMGLLGIPAIQHGNVIEIGSGVVGIDEACSGIRSFQSSIMISLFLGEFYRFGISRRLLLVPLGFLIAFALNVCRTTLLTWVAARKGIAAIPEYHDPAGVSIAITCTLALWGLALVLKSKGRRAESGGDKAEGGERRAEVRRQRAEGKGQRGESRERRAEVGGQKRSTFNIQRSTPKSEASAFNSRTSVLYPLSIGLLAWLIAVEVGVQSWYRSREAHPSLSPNWTIEFPQQNPGFKEVPISSKTESLLRFDDGRQAAWKETDGTEWQAFYFNWNPGRVAGYLAKRHTPEVCLPAAGCRLQSGPELMTANVKGMLLPIRSYVFETAGNALYVFHCRWEQGVGPEASVEHESARYNLVRAIWAGRGNQGQKVLEFVTSGYQDAGQAKEALVRELEKWIRVEAKVAGQ